MNPPAIGTTWRHKNGNLYRVLLLANHATERPEKYPITVVYEGANGNVWCRPVHDWHRSMTFVGGERSQSEEE